MKDPVPYHIILKDWRKIATIIILAHAPTEFEPFKPLDSMFL